MIIRKGNAMVRSLRKKKLFEVKKEYVDSNKIKIIPIWKRL